MSSSRDELLEALENAKRNPPPPVLYESPDPQDDSSQPTDSSSTEPGIRMFTQSPPKPNEEREASCEVPQYECRSRVFSFLCEFNRNVNVGHTFSSFWCEFNRNVNVSYAFLSGANLIEM